MSKIKSVHRLSESCTCKIKSVHRLSESRTCIIKSVHRLSESRTCIIKSVHWLGERRTCKIKSVHRLSERRTCIIKSVHWLGERRMCKIKSVHRLGESCRWRHTGLNLGAGTGITSWKNTSVGWSVRCRLDKHSNNIVNTLCSFSHSSRRWLRASIGVSMVTARSGIPGFTLLDESSPWEPESCSISMTSKSSSSSTCDLTDIICFLKTQHRDGKLFFLEHPSVLIRQTLGDKGQCLQGFNP